ncbi:uncharacterized protein ACO6RY_15741 [Pungitius sinensis]
MDLAEDSRMAEAFSRPFTAGSRRSFPASEARSAASSTLDESRLSRSSGSEELDVVSLEAAEADAEATHSPAAAKELLEVLIRAADRFHFSWSAGQEQPTASSKLHERFLPSRRVPPRRCLPFFPDIHTEVSASWSRPVSARVYNPRTALYSSLAEAKRDGYGSMPAVEGRQSMSATPSSLGGGRLNFGAYYPRW